jgi:conjugative transfer signal peptidase TraF
VAKRSRSARRSMLRIERGASARGGMAPFVKRLAGVPGDSVRVSPEGVSINGAPVLPHSAPLTHNHRGEPLPRRLGRWLICGYWLYGESNPWSFDSRYFGEVPRASIRGVVKPVLVTQVSMGYPLNSSHWAYTYL